MYTEHIFAGANQQTNMRRNHELTRMALQVTNNGQDVIIFLRETMDGTDPRVKVCHQLAAARILSRIGLEDGKKFVKDNCVPRFRKPKDPLHKIWRSIHGAHAEIYYAARQYTRDGTQIMGFLADVMNDCWPKFKPQHRLAAARELLRHIEYIPEGDEGDLPINHGLNVWPGEPPKPAPAPGSVILNVADYYAAMGVEYVPTEPAPVKKPDIYYRPPNRTTANPASATATAAKPNLNNDAVSKQAPTATAASEPADESTGESSPATKTAATAEPNPTTDKPNEPTDNPTANPAATNESQPTESDESNPTDPEDDGDPYYEYIPDCDCGNCQHCYEYALFLEDWGDDWHTPDYEDP